MYFLVHFENKLALVNSAIRIEVVLISNIEHIALL